MGSELKPYLKPVEDNPKWRCPEHGADYGRIESWRMQWECPTCQHNLHETVNAWRRSISCYKHWRDDSGLPRRLRTRTRANFVRDTRELKLIGQAVDRYAGNLSENIERGNGLTLLGPPGLGKTHLMAAVVGESYAHDRRAIYAVWPDVVADVKAGFHQRGERRDPIGTLQSIPLLALDELALKTGASDFEAGLLFELIDHRYRERLPTLVASNATTDNLGAIVGERIADRLSECAPSLLFTGTSRRLAAATSTDLNDAPPHLLRPPSELRVRIHEQGHWRERMLRDEEAAGGG